MSIERISVSTAGFSLNAVNIRGQRVQRLLEQLNRLGGANATQTGGAPAAQPGPGAMQSPADRFRDQIQSPTASNGSAASATDGGADSTGGAQAGFAPGGAQNLQHLDPQGLMNLLMNLLQRLLEAISQMMAGGAQQGGGTQQGGGAQQGCGAQQGGGGAQPGGGAPQPGGGAQQPGGGVQQPGAGGSSGAPPTCGSGSGVPSAPPPTTGGPGASGGTCGPRPNPCAPALGNTNGTPASTEAPVPIAPGPPGRCGTRRSRNARGSRPGGKGAAVKRILKAVGRHGATAATAVAGGGVAGLLPGMIATGPTSAQRIASANRLGAHAAYPTSSASVGGSGSGGRKSLEDQISEYFMKELKNVEGELQSAMQQSEAQGGGAGAGGNGSDSRSAMSQKVQQLVQKRSQMVELLTNSLKTMHDSAMAVNRNIRS